MKFFLVLSLCLCGLMTFLKANDLSISKIEYDLYMMEILVEDFQNRIQFMKQNVKEMGSENVCPDDWVSYNGSCYLFEISPARNFEEARSFCKQKDSVILFVRDEAENTFIRRMLGRFIAKSHWYMGLNDQDSEGNWKWIDTNIPANFIKWSPGQPEGGTKQNCVVYSISDSNRWHDVDCPYKGSVICKKEKSVK